jgi:hypothetical protein
MENLKMTYAEWVEKYKPIKNPFTGNRDYFFDADGKAGEFVAKQNPLCVWTDMDDGEDNFIESGFHRVNRVGNCICEIPFNEDEFIQILLEHKIFNDDGTVTIVDEYGDIVGRYDEDGNEIK